MNYNLGTVTLNSKDKNRMLDFLSDVLEFDVDQNSDLVSHGSFVFKLTSFPTDETNDSPGIAFSFAVKTDEELQEILRKYHFFLFRKPLVETFQEKISLTNLGNKRTLTIEDIDRRQWCFELPFNISSP